MTVINLVGAVVPRAIDTNGDTESGGKLYAFKAGTTTAVTTYSDAAGTTANAHPVVSDAGGAWGAIYVAPQPLKINIEDSGGTSLPGYPIDNVDVWSDGGALNILAISLTPTDADLQTAYDQAQGAPIIIPFGTTVTGSSPITGTHDVHLIGGGTLDFSSNIFATDGSVKLEGLVVDTTAFAIVGDNVTGLVNYEAVGVTFSACDKVVDWRVAGSAAFTAGVGISRFNFESCLFTGGTNIAVHLETRINAMSVTNCDFLNQKYACVWTASNDVRQPEMRNISIIGNRVDTITSNSSADTAAVAFQVQAQDVVISDNVIDNITTTFGVSDSVEVWGIYVKAMHGVIAGNVISTLSSDANDLVRFIAVKGDEVAGADGMPFGFGMVVSNNNLKNTADVYSEGIHAYCDRLKVSGNHMDGIGQAIDTNGGQDFERVEIIDNTAINPPASYRAVACDLRLSGGTHRVNGNTFEDYTLGITPRVNATNVDIVEMSDNEITAADACIAFYDATAGGKVFSKFIINDGIYAGAYLIRWDASASAATPDWSIDGVHIGGITNRFLFIGAEDFRTFTIRNLKGHVFNTTDASDNFPIYITPSADALLHYNVHVTGYSDDATTYRDTWFVETWQKADTATPAIIGAQTSLHDQSNGGAATV